VNQGFFPTWTLVQPILKLLSWLVGNRFVLTVTFGENQKNTPKNSIKTDSNVKFSSTYSLLHDSSFNKSTQTELVEFGFNGLSLSGFRVYGQLADNNEDIIRHTNGPYLIASQSLSRAYLAAAWTTDTRLTRMRYAADCSTK